MQLVRPPTWGDIQGSVDELHRAAIFGHAEGLEVFLDVSQEADKAFHKGAEQLVAPLESFGIAQDATEQIKQDAVRIGQAVIKLLPGVEEVSMKLELMKENSCRRWHQDHYVARAICSYNCAGTEYVHSDHVDFWELENCGNNDCVVPDRTPVQAAGVGDVLFIKGKLFPGEVNALVHKSPGHSYHADGDVKTRLCLKVDVAELP